MRFQQEKSAGSFALSAFFANSLCPFKIKCYLCKCILANPPVPLQRKSVFERFIYVLKHMDILQRMPWMAQDAVFKKLSEIAEVASLDKEERRKYDESLRAYRDTIVVMEGQFLEGERKGLEKGRAEGRVEGEARGRAEEKLENARSLKANGVAEEIIAKSLGLTADEIRKL